MPFETPCSIGPCNAGTARAVGPIDPRTLRAERAAERTAETSDAKHANGVARSVGPIHPKAPLGVGVGEIPVDIDRVSEIRRAIRNGNYPLVPAKVADAMIAAAILLRDGE